ncbi:MAG TPA: glycosyltransferase family 4 protein [Labilithrix sp.]|nr:glycosyltransferase family 4 protein [Labilithrix sp.]
MTTVVHVVVAGEVGGAERMLVDLAGRGAQARHSIALLTPSDRLRVLFRDAGLDVDDRGPVHEGPLSYLARSLGPRDAAWVAEVIGRRRADVVHLHTFGSQVVGTRAARKAGARIVRTEHSTRVYDDPSCWPFSRWSLARADAVVSISEHVARVALAKAPWAARKMSVVPNGVDTAHFAPPGPHVVPAAPAPLRFVALGRLDPRKGLDVALAALAQVEGAALDIVGDGEARASLEALAARLGVADRVTFVGFVDDVRGAIGKADVALSSARAEGLGIALLEAMAMERAVVALPTGGVPEIVADGTTGWLAHGHGVDALTRVMQEAVDRRDEVARRGLQARKSVEARFSIGAMRRGYDAIYDALTR